MMESLIRIEKFTPSVVCCAVRDSARAAHILTAGRIAGQSAPAIQAVGKNAPSEKPSAKIPNTWVNRAQADAKKIHARPPHAARARSTRSTVLNDSPLVKHYLPACLFVLPDC